MLNCRGLVFNVITMIIYFTYIYFLARSKAVLSILRNQTGRKLNSIKLEDIDWRLQAVTAVIMENSNIPVLTPGSPLKVNRHLEGILSPPLWPKEQSASCYQLSLWFHARILRPWRRKLCVSPNYLLTFNGLLDVTTQKIAFFKEIWISLMSYSLWRFECSELGDFLI